MIHHKDGSAKPRGPKDKNILEKVEELIGKKTEK